MERSMWKGVIAFGMISIPVRLFVATGSKDVALHLIHKECHTRIRELRWCPTHEQPVTPGETVKAYEFAKDKYVEVTEEDIDRLPVPSKHTIALAAFVHAEEMAPVYFEKSYYLEPDDLGVKPYALLLHTLEDRNLAALARITIRTRERLCAVHPHDGVLMLDTLFWADEIRLPAASKTPRVEVSERELAMAGSFVDLLMEPFQPEKHQDTYRLALQELIEAKLSGREALVEVVGPPPKVVDLMAALKASIEAARQKKAGGGEAAQEQALGEAPRSETRRRKAG